MTTLSKRTILIIEALSLTLFLYLIFSFIGSLYAYTDNITVSVVTSGMYGENSFCQYLHPLYCKIISFLNPLLPVTDVFATLTHFFLLFGIFMLAYIFFSWASQKPIEKWQLEDYIVRGLILLTIIYFVLGLSVFGINYTVQTSVILAMGSFVLFHAIQSGKGFKWVIAGTVLVFGALLYRVEANLLFFPFLVLDLLTELIRNNQNPKQEKINLKWVAPAVLLIVIMLFSRAAFMHKEPYCSDAEYNNYRTICEDYPMKSFSSARKAPEGLDLEAYNAVLHWTLMDTDVIGKEALKEFAAVGRKTKYELTTDGVVDILKDMRKEVMTKDLHVLVMTWLTIIITL